jgi:hypothetical protein
MSSYRLIARNCDCLLGKAVDDNHNLVVAVLVLWKVLEIYTQVLHGLIRHRQRVEVALELGLSWMSSPTSNTVADVPLTGSFYTLLVVLLGQ